MLLGISTLEWVGYFASAIVAMSLTMSSIKSLRWYNLAGAAVFSFYGFAIHAFPVGFLNLLIVSINIYYLFELYSSRESFKAITVKNTDTYLQYFIDFHIEQIISFFPTFKRHLYFDDINEDIISILLIRNDIVAGIIIGIRENNDLHVVLDFVAPEYRNLKPGDFIYKRNPFLFESLNIQNFRCISENKTHQKYLIKMGFKLKNGVYSKAV